ncbi:MAG TPA: adenylate/guanylate cyclase domain-containing protein [Casimicrobiaceae bacterium]|nr:adenylate/guanylate cyclase domain-containing protein [Casimicrobiaceae bacterium]
MQPDRTASNDQWVVRTVLFVDLVESVRLMESNESDAVRRWRQLVAAVERDILPGHSGRLVKSMGDGLMLEFPSVQPALQAAFAIQRASADSNAGVTADRHMLLRMGAHVGQLIADERDIYGRGVNLAARLTTLAGPGEIVVSADLRDQLVPILDADIEDLGACYVKHVAEPVRCYRVGPPGPRPVIEPGSAAMPELRPTLAVIPFTARAGEAAHQVLGEVLADEIISALSRAAELNVISRLSTTVFRGREASLGEVGGYLNATYVLSGGYLVSGNQFNLSAELADAKSGKVVWAKSFKGQVSGIVSGKDGMIDKAVAGVSAAVMARELQRAQSQPLPTLESYTLLMGAIALMHRLSLRDFDRAKQMLQTLTERAPRQAIPWAWLAKWHVLRVQQGWTDDAHLEARLALDCTKRALDADAQCSLALAIDGFVHTNLLKKLDEALERYDRALRVNPNDSLALLLKGTLHAFKGEGKLAVRDTRHALRLSPLDPMRYFYDSLAATAALSAGEYERAIELAQRSLRANRTHTSTFRAMAIAQWQLERPDDARATVRELLRLEPTLTISGYLDRHPSGGYETGRIWSNALRQAGVPA